jgi:hypothetical protein
MTKLRAVEYDDDAFASRARRLVDSGHTFYFDVRGAASLQLQSHLKNGRIENAASLVVSSKLRPLVGVLMLADSKGQAVSVNEDSGVIRVIVGVGTS